MPTVSQNAPIAEVAREVAGPAVPGVRYVHKKHIVLDLSPGNANAFAFAVQNPEDAECVVTDVIVHIATVGGTARSVLNVDVVNGATATGDDIIDGLSLNATGTFDRTKNGGTNGGQAVKWDRRGETNDYVTGKIATQSAASLAGTVVIEYVPLS